MICPTHASGGTLTSHNAAFCKGVRPANMYGNELENATERVYTEAGYLPNVSCTGAL